MGDDSAPTPLNVVDNPEQRRFEGYIGEHIVGVIEYHPVANGIVATHTEVSQSHEGQGIGSRLVTAVMEHMRAEQRMLRPQCPYIRSWLLRHPEYSDVIDPVPEQ